MNRFALSTAGLATVALAGTAIGATVSFNHQLDRWSGEHAWQMTDSDGNAVASFAGGVTYGSTSSWTYSSFPSTTSHAYSIYFNMDLAAGDYHVDMQDTYGDGWAWGTFVGGLYVSGAIDGGSAGVSFPTGASRSFDFTVVPAPGAMALLGLAGLASRRRRRD
jgi:MYXO-CTERM domain-containing protein